MCEVGKHGKKEVRGVSTQTVLLSWLQHQGSDSHSQSMKGACPRGCLSADFHLLVVHGHTGTDKYRREISSVVCSVSTSLCGIYMFYLFRLWISWLFCVLIFILSLLCMEYRLYTNRFILK